MRVDVGALLMVLVVVDVVAVMVEVSKLPCCCVFPFFVVSLVVVLVPVLVDGRW